MGSAPPLKHQQRCHAFKDPQQGWSNERVTIRSLESSLGCVGWGKLRKAVELDPHKGPGEKTITSRLSEICNWIMKDDSNEVDRIKHLANFSFKGPVGLHIPGGGDWGSIEAVRRLREVLDEEKKESRKRATEGGDADGSRVGKRLGMSTTGGERGRSIPHRHPIWEHDLADPYHPTLLPSPRDFPPPPDLPTRSSRSTTGSQSSRAEGHHKPDGAIVSDLLSAEVDCVILHAWREDKSFPFDGESGLRYVMREGTYQGLWYSYLGGVLCGTRLGMLVVNSAFQRFLYLENGSIAVEMAGNRAEGMRRTISLDELDVDDEFWEAIPNTLLTVSDEVKEVHAEGKSLEQGEMLTETAPAREIEVWTQAELDAKVVTEVEEKAMTAEGGTAFFSLSEPNSDAKAPTMRETETLGKPTPIAKPSLSYNLSAQSRFIQFYQSAYLLGALSSCPEEVYTSSSLPRPSQKVSEELELGDVRAAFTWGESKVTATRRTSGGRATRDITAATNDDANADEPSSFPWARLERVEEGIVGIGVLKRRYHEGVKSAKTRAKKEIEKAKRGQGRGRGGRRGRGAGGSSGQGSRGGKGDEDGADDKGGNKEGDGGGTGGDTAPPSPPPPLPRGNLGYEYATATTDLEHFRILLTLAEIRIRPISSSQMDHLIADLIAGVESVLPLSDGVAEEMVEEVKASPEMVEEVKASPEMVEEVTDSPSPVEREVVLTPETVNKDPRRKEVEMVREKGLGVADVGGAGGKLLHDEAL